MTGWQSFQGDGQVHVEGPIATTSWRVYGRFLMHGGTLKLVEVRVFPGPDRAPLQRGSGSNPFGSIRLGEWDESLATLDRMPAPQAISSRMMRAIDFSRMLEEARATVGLAQRQAEWLADGLDDSESAARLIAVLQSTLEAPVAKVPDVGLARLAQKYAAISAANATPMNELARRLGKDRGYVKQYVDAARAKGYLTKPGQGKRRSDLTEAAIEVLARSGTLTPARGADKERSEEL